MNVGLIVGLCVGGVAVAAALALCYYLRSRNAPQQGLVRVQNVSVVQYVR